MVELLRLLFSIEQDFQFDESKQRRGLSLLLESEDALLLTAGNSGRVIGMCSAQRTISTAEGGYSLLLEDVVVNQEFQGRGVAGKLLLAVEQWALARKILRLQLLGDRSNGAALKFYQKRGWQTTNLVSLWKYPHL
jgi:GNAT superfamily N-acetyltransferase